MLTFASKYSVFSTLFFLDVDFWTFYSKLNQIGLISLGAITSWKGSDMCTFLSKYLVFIHSSFLDVDFWTFYSKFNHRGLIHLLAITSWKGSDMCTFLSKYLIFNTLFFFRRGLLDFLLEI